MRPRYEFNRARARRFRGNDHQGCVQHFACQFGLAVSHIQSLNFARRFHRSNFLEFRFSVGNVQ